MKGSWTGVTAEQLSPSAAHLTFIRIFPLEEEIMWACLGSARSAEHRGALGHTVLACPRRAWKVMEALSTKYGLRASGISIVKELVRNTDLLNQTCILKDPRWLVCEI